MLLDYLTKETERAQTYGLSRSLASGRQSGPLRPYRTSEVRQTKEPPRGTFSDGVAGKNGKEIVDPATESGLPAIASNVGSQRSTICHDGESLDGKKHNGPSHPTVIDGQSGPPPPNPTDFSHLGASVVSQIKEVKLDDPTIPPKQRLIGGNSIPNIVVFGETGVGKSSIINLIAGRTLAHTSNDARGCTLRYKQHTITFNNISFALWDTAGLDEGSKGAVPAEEAERRLKELLEKLALSGGINLVIYCIRCSRIISALKRNYDLFYVTACRKQVPVALVVTGLEHEERDMNAWWTTNEKVLQEYRMYFEAHACITTLDVEDPVIQKRLSESQKCLRNLVIEYSGRDPWTCDPSFISWVSPLLHHRISTSMSSWGGSTITRKVTICDFSTGTDILGTDGIMKKHGTRRIGSGQYQTIRVDRQALTKVTREKLERVRGLGEGVLVFYASLMRNYIPSDEVKALKTFYDIAGGQIYPVIVVLRDCRDERVANMCGAQLPSRSGLQGTKFVALAITIDDQRKVDEAIEHLCIEQEETKPTRLQRLTSYSWPRGIINST